MTDEQLVKLINATLGSQGNTERLIRIEEKLSNHLDNCHAKQQVIDTHVKQSVAIRDDVKANSAFRRCASKCLWVVYASLVTIAGKLMFFN